MTPMSLRSGCWGEAVPRAGSAPQHLGEGVQLCCQAHRTDLATRAHNCLRRPTAEQGKLNDHVGMVCGSVTDATQKSLLLSSLLPAHKSSQDFQPNDDHNRGKYGKRDTKLFNHMFLLFVRVCTRVSMCMHACMCVDMCVGVGVPWQECEGQRTILGLAGL